MALFNSRVTSARIGVKPTVISIKLSVSLCLMLPSLAMLPANALETSQSIVNSELLLECTSLLTDPARLACYDKVINEGISTVARPKKPLDLAKTVKSIATGKPLVVLAEERYKTPESEVLAKAGVKVGDVLERTPLSRAYDLDGNDEIGLWTPRPYNPIYVLPVFTAFERNQHPISPTIGTYEYQEDEYDSVELKAQISVKTKVMQDLFSSNADLWIGYTQQMHWQVYNDDYSRPFRGTDYLPEIFLTQPVKAELPFDGYLRMLGVGRLNQSRTSLHCEDGDKMEVRIR